MFATEIFTLKRQTHAIRFIAVFFKGSVSFVFWKGELKHHDRSQKVKFFVIHGFGIKRFLQHVQKNNFKRKNFI